jgi:hypothetical protein
MCMAVLRGYTFPCGVSQVKDTYNFLGHACGSANSRWLGKPSCGNILWSNLLLPMLDDSKGGVLASEVSERISLICVVVWSFITRM